jgi:hypothetical protein
MTLPRRSGIAHVYKNRQSIVTAALRRIFAREDPVGRTGPCARSLPDEAAIIRLIGAVAPKAA